MFIKLKCWNLYPTGEKDDYYFYIIPVKDIRYIRNCIDDIKEVKSMVSTNNIGTMLCDSSVDEIFEMLNNYQLGK